MAETNPQGPPAPRRVLTMDGDHIDELMWLILRIRSVRSDAVRHLLPEHFSKDQEAYLSVLWRAVLELHDRYPKGEAIPYPAICNACRELASDPATGLPADQWHNLLDTDDDFDEDDPDPQVGLLFHAYNKIRKIHLDKDHALVQLRRFLHERAGVEPIVRQIRAADAQGLVLPDVAALLDAGRRNIARYDTIGTSPFESFDFDLDTLGPLPVAPSGLPFFDKLMDGGPAAPEIIGILGPTGGGKSTSLSQLAVARVLMCHADADAGRERRQVFLVSYEDNALGVRLADGTQTVGTIFARTVGNLANVDRRVVSNREKFGGFTRTGQKLRAYEYELHPGQDPATVPGEYERIRAAQKILGAGLSVVNMGLDGRGYGGVAEIVGLIEAQMERTGCRPSCILVDSINLLCLNHLVFQGKDPDKTIRRAIIDTVFECRRLLAERFQCDVWVTNQLEAAQNKRAATAAGHHSEATDAKGWANALDFAWVFNMPDINRFTTFTLSKARRGGCDGQQVVMQLDGLFARWRDRSPEYVVHQGEFQLRSIVEQFAVAPAAAPQTSISQVGDPTGLAAPWDNA